MLRPAMLRLFRPFVILITVFALTLANATWAADGATAAHSTSRVHYHPASSQAPGAQHHNHDGKGKVQDAADCAEDGRSGCSPDRKSEHPTKSCCGAMACHAAIPATSCSELFIPLTARAKVLSLDSDLKQQRLSRLDRPPRIAGV
jgi:hypothetical protein